VAYLVDGNNVMGQRVGWHRDRAGAQRRLLRELARFAQASGTPVTVVFDGQPDADVPDGATVDGVRVHYAAPGADADARIVELVRRAPAGGAPTVVTSDRLLIDRVRAHGARVIRSGELRRSLDEPASEAPGGGAG
jgi:predicted RNA-binding protein with PIN domain